jgi:uroporphyrinogen-III synthase
LIADWRLLLTRPREECASLAALLAEQGVVSNSLPLLEIQPLPEDATQRALIRELDRFNAVIVVSKPAARLGLQQVDRYWPRPPPATAWFSVGAATARVLQDHGRQVAFPPEADDSEALLALPAFRAALDGHAPRALIMRGEDGREWLAERLRHMGVQVDYLPLYRRALPTYPPGELARRVAAERLNGLVVSSGQGFEHLLALAAEAWPQLAQLPLFVPSPRVAQLARDAGAQEVVDCRGASASALLAALRSHSAGSAP